MKIYLDIDGTMIHEELTDNNCKPAAGLLKFLEALRPHETYWLTTHCTTGDPEKARRIMKEKVPVEYHHDIDRIKPTVWQDMKTDALDWGADFIWFDNDIFEAEWKVLERCHKNQSVIQVDLRANPHHLIEIVSEVLNEK